MAFLPQHRQPGTYVSPYGIEAGSVFGGLLRDNNGFSDMAVDGSILTKKFRITAPQDVRVAVNVFTINIKTSGPPAPGLFGDLPSLTNGLEIVIEDPGLNVVATLTEPPIRDNEDWYMTAPEFVRYEFGPLPPSPGCVSALTRTNPAEDGFVIRAGFSFAVHIKDDLSGLRQVEAAISGRNLIDFVNKTDN